jgi:DNA-binding PadR family transcriptional regulator
MSIKFVILGLLMEGEKHPYEIQQLIKQREMQRYIKFQKGSLYYSVNQLEKDKFVEVVSVVRETNRPDKTIYRITEMGKAEFYRLFAKQFSTYDTFYNPLYAAFAFIKYLDNNELIDILKKRISRTEAMLQKTQLIYEKLEHQIPRFGLHIFMGSIEQIKTEIIGLNEILKDAVDGVLTEYGSIRPYDKNIDFT